MPARRLTAIHERCPAFSVIGAYSPWLQNFVNHAALLRDERSLEFGETAEVHHMGPPLGMGSCEAHVVGMLDDLTTSEVRKLEQWRRRYEIEAAPGIGRRARLDGYIVVPPIDPLPDAITGRDRSRRFSCVGFVLFCYHQIGVTLVDWNVERLPRIGRPLLEQTYGGALPDRLLKRWGLDGEGPWPVVLAGYLFHSLDRTDAEIRRMPYVPASANEGWFPRP